MPARNSIVIGVMMFVPKFGGDMGERLIGYWQRFMLLAMLNVLVYTGYYAVVAYSLGSPLIVCIVVPIIVTCMVGLVLNLPNMIYYSLIQTPEPVDTLDSSVTISE